MSDDSIFAGRALQLTIKRDSREMLENMDVGGLASPGRK